MRFVAIDFECTGPVDGWPNEPWQLGAVALEDGRVIRESAKEFFFHIDPGRPFSPRSPGRWADIRNMLAASPSFAESWEELSSLLCGVPLVAHNASVERTMLTRNAPLAQFGPWLDTLALVRKYWPTMKSHKLGDLIRTFGLEAELRQTFPDRTWHDGLYDAYAGALLLAHVGKILINGGMRNWESILGRGGVL